MNYAVLLVNLLLDKYESSKGYQTGVFNQRIRLKINQEEMFSEAMENGDEHARFLADVELLEQKEIVCFDWVRFEEGNLVKDIWLCLDHVEEAYAFARRKPLALATSQMIEMVKKALQEMKHDSPLKDYLASKLAWMEEKKRPFKLFENKDLEGLLKCLVFLHDNQTQWLERVLSTHLYKDSKYFEKEIKKPLLSILRAIDKDEEHGEGDLLLEYGISRYPEVIEFCGSLIVFLQNGSCIDYGSQIHGAYINSLTIDDIDSIEIKCDRILSIENKANYIACVQSRKPNELILYHGGCYSPAKERFFKKIAQASSCKVDHWSDIDLGGFRIFTRLKENIFPQAQPYQMDLQTLRKHESACLPITSTTYLKQLEEMYQEPRYAIFHEVIAYMLAKRIKLEEENILV